MSKLFIRKLGANVDHLSHHRGILKFKLGFQDEYLYFRTQDIEVPHCHHFSDLHLHTVFCRFLFCFHMHLYPHLILQVQLHNRQIHSSPRWSWTILLLYVPDDRCWGIYKISHVCQQHKCCVQSSWGQQQQW